MVYGKLRLPTSKPKAASFTHRTIGDTPVVVTLKVIVVRWWPSVGPFLPHFGLTAFSLLEERQNLLEERKDLREE